MRYSAGKAGSLSQLETDRLIRVSAHGGCCVDAIQIDLHCTKWKKHLLCHKTKQLIFTVHDLGLLNTLEEKSQALSRNGKGLRFTFWII